MVDRTKPYASLPKLDLDAPVLESNEPRKRSHNERDYHSARARLPEIADSDINDIEAPHGEGLYGVREERGRRGSREPYNGYPHDDDEPHNGYPHDDDDSRNSYHEDDEFANRPPRGTRRKPPTPPNLRPRNGMKKKKPKQRRKSLLSNIRINPLYVSIASWSAVSIATIVVFVWFISGLFVDNAFAVFLDGELIGHIHMTDGLTSEQFHDSAVLRLQASRGGARVNVRNRVTIEEARVAGNERSTHDVIFGLLQRRFSYTIAAIGIHVNGRCEGITLRTPTDLEQLKLMLQEYWFNEFTVKAEFIQPWAEVIVYVDPDDTDFWTPQEAYGRLSRMEMQMYTYMIQRGDNLERIANRFGTPVWRIMEDNGLTNYIIHPYTTLEIEVPRPLLSVRTFDEISTEEPIPMPVEERENPSLSLHTPNIIQHGSPGLQRSVLRITRENGVERHRETLEAEVLVPPVIHIVEVGTGAPAQDVR